MWFEKKKKKKKKYQYREPIKVYRGPKGFVEEHGRKWAARGRGYLKERKGREQLLREEMRKAMVKKEKQKIRKKAERLVGYKEPKRRGKRYKRARREGIRIARGHELGFLDVGGSVPVFRREESFASLMTEGRGMSLGDFAGGGRSIADYSGNKKKKRFSLAEW